MRTIACLALFLITVSSALAAPPRIDLRVTKKTVERNKGSEQDVPLGTTRYEEQLIKYEITLISRSSRAPDSVLVEWAVLVENPGGRITEAERGSKVAALTLGRGTEVETGVVTLAARSWDLRERMHSDSGKVSTTIYGYGIRVVDEDENVLVEKYSKSDVKAKIDWDKPAGIKDLAPKEAPFKNLLPGRVKRKR